MNAITSPPTATDAGAAALVESFQALARQACRYLVQLREFDLHKGYRQRLKGGKATANTADWLHARCGADRRTVAEDLGVAYSLLKVPAIETAFAAGELSYRKVRALIRVADAGSEHAILDFARSMSEEWVEAYCRELTARRYNRGRSRQSEGASMPADDDMVIYHNPACGKCRAALAILRERDARFEVVDYLRSPLDEPALRRLLDALEDEPAELVRKDANFHALGLSSEHYATVDAVVDLLVRHPRLMQRPVLVRGDRAVIARSPEKIEALL